MKNIYAKSTTSIEGVIIAAIHFWLIEAGIDDLTVEATGMERDVDGFPAFADREIGRALCETRDYVKEFSDFANSNPYLTWMIGQYASGDPGLNPEFIADQIYTFLGKRMKASDWWIVNETSIRLESKRAARRSKQAA